MDDTVLVADFGTSYFKFALVDRSASIRAFARVPTPIQRDGLRSEIAPPRFVAAVRSAIADLGSQHPHGLAGVSAITFCTQANTFLLTDQDDRPLTPLIVWNDERARETAGPIIRLGETADYSARSGIPLLGPTFAMAKVRHLLDLDSTLPGNTRRMCFLGDFFTRWLVGTHVTDGSVAALSGLFDVPAWRWVPEWCETARIDPAWLPEVVRAGTTLGPILPAVAQDFGLPPHCLFVMGCLDQYAGAVGVGNDRPGDLSETTGTVLATVRCAESFDAPAAPTAFRGPAATAERFYHMTFGDVSAALLEHYRRQLPDQPSFEPLDAAAEEAEQTRLDLNPALPAEALKAQLEAWASNAAPRGAVVCSVYRCVAAALAEQVGTLAGDAPVSLVRSAGGASRSRRWLQIKANALGCPILAPQSPEPTLIGSAVLAARSLGWAPLLPSDLDRPADRLIHPQLRRA